MTFSLQQLEAAAKTADAYFAKHYPDVYLPMPESLYDTWEDRATEEQESQ